MADGSESPRAWPKPHQVAIGGGGVVVLVLLVIWAWSCFTSGPCANVCVRNPNDASCLPPPIQCPRPSSAPNPPGFGGQEGEIRELRRRAFAGDFFAQVDLAHRY